MEVIQADETGSDNYGPGDNGKDDVTLGGSASETLNRG
jgi:hypothetical protein